MQPEAITTESHSNAEILLWQSRFRLVFLPLVGLSAVALKWFGVISAESVLEGRFGARPLLVFTIGMIVLYLIGHRFLAYYLTRGREAGIGLVVAATGSDIIGIFIIVACITPPEHYARALVVSVFVIQFTQLFFGWTATVGNLALVAVGYTTLVAVAADAGGRISPAEELWTLALYGIGVLLWVALQGHVSRRMQNLVHVFTRAQGGDFTARYEEEPNEFPDPIAVIGRAYNRMRSDLETIVLTDPLSGCFNRRGLAQLTEREVSRGVRGKKNIAVLAVDIDHFKSINDAYGHLTGDEVIREIGALLQDTSRDPDVVARIGGEEFLVLAPESDDEGALILADRIMDAFREHSFKSLPKDCRITASIGIAADAARDDEVAKRLMARADEALYIAKRNGRNRAVVWQAGMRAFDGTSARVGAES